MDDEPEMIRHQMEEKRTELSDRIQQLEQQVADKVQDATTAAKETVESVKEAVTETVDAIKGSVQETVSTVKETFDIPLQFERHPWAMFGGSVALGFLGGALFPSSPRRAWPGWSSLRMPESRTGAPAVRGSFGDGHPDGFSHETRARSVPQTREAIERFTSGSPGRGLLNSLGGAVEGELDKIKGLGVSLLAAAVRDLLKPALPEPIQERAVEILDDLTRKLGGEPIRGPLFSVGAGGRSEAEEGSQPTQEAGWGHGDNPVAHRSSMGSL
jgi:ElaB/YqjD/DUF883 family membrane-anchored ribosome-binding protein